MWALQDAQAPRLETERDIALEAAEADSNEIRAVGANRLKACTNHRLVPFGQSLHDFPEIHQHAALAGTVVDHIEMFPRDRPFDVRHRLTLRSAHERVAHGRLLPEHASGLGIVLDLDQVARHAIRHSHVGR